MDSMCLAEPTDGLLPSGWEAQGSPWDRFSNGELRLCRGREGLATWH